MGKEIDRAFFDAEDFEKFQHRLQQEMACLRQMFEANSFVSNHAVGGYELEAWLIDSDYRPAPINQEFIHQLSNPLVVHELSRFNVELNSKPHELRGKALSSMEKDFSLLWQSCTETAAAMDARLAMMGTLPVLDESLLTIQNMSAVQRYRALNEQVFRLRKGKPIRLDIQGADHLVSTHYDVMLEAAATSFQIHLQVPPDNSVRYYNASVLCSLPLLASAVNSPYLFGKDLWDETRIPLFEQSVSTDERSVSGHTGQSRVTFGHGWCQDSILELFEENIRLYPVLLPTLHDQDAEALWHLLLHNGTIWRWIRPLIGTETSEYHLRIEQRVVPAGPTIPDAITNAAFYFGLTRYLAHLPVPPESQIEFGQVKEDFYRIARHGLRADIHWPGIGRVNVRELILEQLIACARTGLEALELDRADIDHYLGILRDRVDSGQTGAGWQRKYVKHHQCGMREMTQAYLGNQNSAVPVHLWEI